MVRRDRVVRAAFALAVLATSLVFAALPASANNNGSWSVAPTGDNGITPRDWFEYELRPGQTIRDMVSVSNLTDHDMTFFIYPADAYNTPLDGAFALNLKKDPSKDEGSWIHLGYDSYTVPAHSRADFPFEIDVPADAAPGDHAAGIVAEDAEAPTPVDQGKGIAVQQRVATRVYIRVQGPLHPDLQVTQIADKHKQALLPPFTGRGEADIAYVVTNTGNIRMGGTSTLRIKGFFGRVLKTYEPVTFPELLPGQSVAFSQHLDTLPIADRVTAEVTVTGEGVHTVRSHSFWVIPWVYVITGLLILLGLYLWHRRRRKQRQAGEPSSDMPDRGVSQKEPALV